MSLKLKSPKRKLSPKRELSPKKPEPVGKRRYRCAACLHEGDYEDRDACESCNSEDIFECGTPESEAEWTFAEEDNRRRKQAEERRQYEDGW